MPETRRIENYGILKLLPPERGAVELIITCDVIQLPYSEYVNLKTNPFKSHYGYVCLMHKEYVLDVIDIQFRRQIIAYRNRHLVQLAWQEYCNSKTIAAQLGAPLPDTSVDYSVWLCDELRFRLEPGVIINVFKSHIPPVTCGSGGIVEPELVANPPGIPESPLAPPPPTTPETDKVPLSSPYEGDNDNGNTYVRDIPQTPPPDPTPQGDCNQVYPATWQYTYTSSSGQTVQNSGSNMVFGGFLGIFQEGGRIFLRSNRAACGGGFDEVTLAVSSETISNFSGTASI